MQNDLETISNWAKRWQIQFNSAKCKVMYIGRSSPQADYYIDGYKLQSAECEKDLGVTVSPTSVSSQSREAYSRSMRNLGFMCRTFVSRNVKIMLSLQVAGAPSFGVLLDSM